MTSPERRSRARRQDDDDAAVVLTIVAALAASNSANASRPATPAAPTIWGDPAHRLGVGRVSAGGASAAGWWASGMPR